MKIDITPTFVAALKSSLKNCLSEKSYSIAEDISLEDEPEVIEMLVGRAVINELIEDALLKTQH